MGIRWMSGGYQTDDRWVSDGCQMDLGLGARISGRVEGFRLGVGVRL